jgi:hypothetical protein
MLQTMIKNRWLLLTLIGVGMVVWLLLSQPHWPALSAPSGVQFPG